MIALQEAHPKNNQKSKYGFGETLILKYLLNDFLGEFCSGISFYPGRYISPNEIFEELKLQKIELFNDHLARLKEGGLIEGCDNYVRMADDALLYALANLRCVFCKPMEEFNISTSDMEALVKAYMNFKKGRRGDFKRYQDFVLRGKIK